MAFENKPGQGALFTRKAFGSRPTLGGNLKCCFCEQEGDLAGWEKQGNKGGFISLKMQPPREREPF